MTACLIGDRASVADSHGTTLVVHVEDCHVRGRLLIRALPQPKHQRLNALTTVQFARSILVKSRAIAISL